MLVEKIFFPLNFQKEISEDLLFQVNREIFWMTDRKSLKPKFFSIIKTKF